MKGLAFSKLATPALAETSTISAKGENGLWDDDEAGSSSTKDKSSRARRELSVIEETSIVQRDGDAASVDGSLEAEAEDEGPAADVSPDTEDELDEGDGDEPDEPISKEGGNHVSDTELEHSDLGKQVDI